MTDTSNETKQENAVDETVKRPKFFYVYKQFIDSKGNMVWPGLHDPKTLKEEVLRRANGKWVNHESEALADQPGRIDIERVNTNDIAVKPQITIPDKQKKGRSITQDLTPPPIIKTQFKGEKKVPDLADNTMDRVPKQTIPDQTPKSEPAKKTTTRKRSTKNTTNTTANKEE